MSCSTVEVAPDLERFGELVLIRPEPRAIWDRGMDELEWRRVSAAEFCADWPHERAVGSAPKRARYMGPFSTPYNPGRTCSSHWK